MKRIFSLLLSTALVLCSIPLAGLVSAEEAAVDTVYTIFMADPEILGATGTVATSSENSSTVPVTTAIDEDGTYYYTLEKNFNADDRWHGFAYAKSGYDNNSKGTNDYGTAWNLNWIGIQTVLDKLAGLVDASCEYRITQTGAAVKGVTLYIAGANTGVASNWIVNDSITQFGDWHTTDTTLESITNFYKGNIMIKSDLNSKAADTLTVKTDIRNIKLTVKESNRQAINEALADTDYDFDALIAPYLKMDDDDIIDYTNYTIWEANPDNHSAESGESVKANLNSNAAYSPMFDVVKMTDDGSYYRTEMKATGSGGDQFNTVIDSGISVNNRGYGWLEDVTVLQTLRPFMTVNFEYRVNATSGSVPSNGLMYINTAGAYSGKSTSLCQGFSMANATDWTEYSVKLSGNSFASWYLGYIGLSIYSSGGKFNGSYNIDLRNFEITLNSADEVAINEALKAADSLWKFDDIVQSDPDFNSHNSIWYASPERLGANVGDDVTGEMASPAKYKTYVASERGVEFYRTEMTVSDGGGNHCNAVIKSGLDSSTEGFGWMDNLKVLNALAPYMYITFDYRFKGTETIPANAYIFYGAASKNGKVCQMGNVQGGSTYWKTVELSLLGAEFTDVWSDGYFIFNIYSGSSFSGKQVIDIRNIRIEFRDCDRLAINDALNSVSGISSVANFTNGIIRDRDESGSYSYYDILLNWLPDTEFDANDDDLLNILDIVRMKKITAKTNWAPKVIKQRLDCDGDDKVTSTELASAKKALLSQVIPPYTKDPLKVGLVTEHPGVADMDAYYELSVKDEQKNEITADTVTVTVNNPAVTVDGYNLTVPYAVRSADEKLTVTVTSKTDSTVYGRYDFEFIKFTDQPTLKDDFDSINTDLWSETYNEGTYEIEDGKLKFTSEVGQTVGLTTKNKFEQAYGSFSASIKMPEKALANGAFWLYSNSGKIYRRNPLNPSISGGEIDIVEYFPTWTNGFRWSTTIHWYGQSDGHHRYSGTDSLDAGVDLGNDYHVYSAVWTKTAVYSYLDGKLYRVYNGEGVSDHSDGMQVILSLHGNSSDSSWGGKFNAEDYPDTMKTDWVKIYGLVE